MEYILSIIIGYTLGSIPTAYILLQKVKGIDIRNQGSGNVGTMNSYEVTNSKRIGITVLIIDLFKGILSVIVVKFLFNDQFILSAISLVSAIFGHCFSIWLKFKGGRGLATAAGGSLVLNPTILILWLVSWYITHKLKKDIHIANISATIFTLIISIIFASFLNNYSFPPASKSFIFGFYISLMMLIILIKHWQPFLEIISKN